MHVRFITRFFLFIVLLSHGPFSGQEVSGQEQAGSVPLGSFVSQVDALSAPRDVAVDAAGRIYVANTASDEVLVLDRDGAITARWPGMPESASIVPCRPEGIAIAPDGVVYICDTGNHRVIRLGDSIDPPGDVLVFGAKGPGKGQLNRPTGLIVTDDRVFVADTGNHRIAVFTRDGVALRTIGRHGSAIGELSFPRDVAVDGAGNICVVDSGNHRVQVFNGSGAFVRQWGEWGSFPGLFSDPQSIAIQAGRLFITDRLGHRVQVFDVRGNFIYQWGMHAVIPREGEGRIHYPGGIAVSATGQFAVIAEPFEDRVQVFGPQTGQTEVSVGGGLPGSRGMQSHFGAQITIADRLLAVWEPETRSVHIFDMLHEIPIMVTRFGEPGSRPGFFGDIAGLQLEDDVQTLRITDPANGFIQTFRLDFDPERPIRFDQFMSRFVKSYDLHWFSQRNGMSIDIEPADIERAQNGKTYVLDARAEAVHVFSDDMRLLKTFGGHGTSRGQLRQPADLAIDSANGDVYIVDAGNHRIQVFNGAGDFLRSFGDLLSPFGIAISADGFVYVSDTVECQVTRFDRQGIVLSQIGERGLEKGQFWKPMGLAIDRHGRLVVVDYGNHRLQIFDADGEWEVVFGVGRAWTNRNRKTREEAADE